MQTMYAGKVNSPATTLDGGINSVITTINIINGAVIPAAPNIAVIGTEENAETILYATKVGNQLSNITRGFQGVAKEWSSGEAIARLFTEYDYGALKGNVGTLAGRKITDFGECSSAELRGKITDETGSGKLVFGTYPEITKIDLIEGQIRFPAIANPNALANVLDDYEEGLWTPVLKFDGNSIDMTYTTQAGLYTKVGNKVTVAGFIALSSKGTSIGSAAITGLPFTCKNNAGAYAPALLSLGNITFANAFYGFVNINTTLVALREITEAGVVTDLRNSDFANDSWIVIKVDYFTD